MKVFKRISSEKLAEALKKDIKELDEEKIPLCSSIPKSAKPKEKRAFKVSVTNLKGQRAAYQSIINRIENGEFN